MALNVLKNKLASNSVRTCIIDGTTCVSVTDVLGVVKELRNPRSEWNRVKDAHPDLARRCHQHRFYRNKPTDVASALVIVEILMCLSTEDAIGIRKEAAYSLLRTMNPDEEFCSLVRERLDYRHGNDEDHEGDWLFSPEDVIKSTAGDMCPYNLYVRVRLPEAFVVNTDHEKPLTKNVIKFGMTNRLNERNTNYRADNGFMAYSIQTRDRQDAQIVERIIRRNFEYITVYNSYEYLDAHQLARVLELSEFHDDYDDYLKVAERLFVTIVNKLKQTWEGVYDATYGSVYSCVQVPSDSPSFQATLSLNGTVERPNPSNRTVVLSYPVHHITQREAAAMGIRLSPDVARAVTIMEESRIAKYEDEIASLRAQLEASREDNVRLHQQLVAPHTSQAEQPLPSSSTRPFPNLPRSHKPSPVPDASWVVSHDVLTHEEETFKCASQAYRSANIECHTFARSFLNKPRVLRGKVYRSFGNRMWLPPHGTVVDSENIGEQFREYVEAKSPERTYVFETITAAARYLAPNHAIRDRIKERVKTGGEYWGFIWRRMPADELEWIDPSTFDHELHHRLVYDARDAFPGAFPDDPPEQDPPSIDVTKAAGRVIEHELSTGNEKTYDNIHACTIANGMSVDVFVNNFLDKRRQYRGKHFRLATTGLRWQPPPTFVYDVTSFAKRCQWYIMHTREDGTVAIYEGVKHAVDLAGLRKNVIDRAIDRGSTAYGGHWKKVPFEEVGEMVAC